MPGASSDPYAVLGVAPRATDAELRSAYRRLAQLHHPDHNHGSPEAARRFAAIQAAYARALELRQATASGGPQAAEASERSDRPGAQGQGPARDPAIEARIAALEQELQKVRRRARRTAAAAEPARPARPTPEELGYFTTDDSIEKILDDVEAELGGRLARSPLARRLSKLLGSDHEQG